MAPISSGKDGKGECGKVTQAIFMRDLDEPHRSMLVAQDESESESFQDLFQEGVDNGWTNVALSQQVPKDDVTKVKQIHETSYKGRVKDVSGKLQEKAKETAGLAAEASEVCATAGLSFIAEKIGYYATGKTAHNLVGKLQARSPFLVELKTAFFKGRNHAVSDRERKHPKTTAERLAVNYAYPPNPRRPVQRAPILSKDDRNDGAMEDVPLSEDEESEWDGTE